MKLSTIFQRMSASPQSPESADFKPCRGTLICLIEFGLNVSFFLPYARGWLLVPVIRPFRPRTHGVKKVPEFHKFESNLALSPLYWFKFVDPGHFFDSMCTSPYQVRPRNLFIQGVKLWGLIKIYFIWTPFPFIFILSTGMQSWFSKIKCPLFHAVSSRKYFQTPWVLGTSGKSLFALVIFYYVLTINYLGDRSVFGVHSEYSVFLSRLSSHLTFCHEF